MTDPIPPINPFKPQPVLNKTLLIVIIAATACLFLIIGFFAAYYYFSGSFEKTAVITPEISQTPIQTSSLVIALPQPQDNASSTQTPQNFLTVQSPINEINAKFLTSIDLNYKLNLKEYPETEFKIIKITKAWGGVLIRGLKAPCNYLEQDKPIFIFIKDTACQETTELTESATSALVVVDFEIINNSARDVHGRFLQMKYDLITDSGQVVERLTTANPNWIAYGAFPFSSKGTTVGFIIPETQNEMVLLYGNYGSPFANETTEDILSKTVNGLIINFTNNTFSEIQG